MIYQHNVALHCHPSMQIHEKVKNIQDNKEHYRVYARLLSVANDRLHIQIADTKQSVLKFMFLHVFPDLF